MERLTDEGLIAIIWLSEQHDGYYKPYEEDHFEYKESIHDSAIDILEILKESNCKYGIEMTNLEDGPLKVKDFVNELIEEKCFLIK